MVMSRFLILVWRNSPALPARMIHHDYRTDTVWSSAGTVKYMSPEQALGQPLIRELIFGVWAASL